jgi:FAD/FMN-containing dehydrogenase
VISSGTAGYLAARAIWNGQVDRYPAVIARCRDTSDVATALRYARSAGMAVAVRGGGHNVAGHPLCDGELVIDVSGMRDVTVHPDSGRATVQGGAGWATSTAWRYRPVGCCRPASSPTPASAG